MLSIDKLNEYGANTAEGLGRCLNDEGFYLSLVESVLPDDRIEQLEAAITANDLDKAFEVAHALKGMYGNIGITPIYEPVSEMTELLRSRTVTDYTPLLEEAKKQKQKLVEIGG